jgi:hypothetical protein
MEKKLSYVINMKPIIEALKDGKKSNSELKNLEVFKEYRDPDKTLARLLDALNYWGLAEKEKETNYWVWCENYQIIDSEEDYKRAIEHSRKLLPVLELMQNFAFNPEDPYYEYVKQHLKSYPDTHENLEKLENLTSPKNKELLQRILQSVRDPYNRLEHYKYNPHQLIPYLQAWKPQDLIYKETRNNLLAKLKKSGFEKYNPTYRDFAGDITFLKSQVENGQPLEGICSICPKIKIRNREK